MGPPRHPDHGTRSCGPTSPKWTSRCRSSSTTTKPPSSWPPPSDSIRNDDSIVEMLARTGLRVDRVLRAHRRRHRQDERDPLAARPGRQTPHRPLRPAAPDHSIELHRDWVDWNGPNDHRAAHLEQGSTARPRRRRRIVDALRRHRRDRPRPPSPTAPHARDPVDQQRHEPRSRRPPCWATDRCA